MSGFVRHVKFPSRRSRRRHAWICGRWSVKRGFAPLNSIHGPFGGGGRHANKWKRGIETGRKAEGPLAIARDREPNTFRSKANTPSVRPSVEAASISLPLPSHPVLTCTSPSPPFPLPPFAPPFRELTNASIRHHRSQSVTTMGLLCDVPPAAPPSSDVTTVV